MNRHRVPSVWLTSCLLPVMLPPAVVMWARILRLLAAAPPPARLAAGAPVCTQPGTGGISAVIVAWNGWTMTRQLLQSLQRQQRQADEIILVDNGSTDGTAGAVHREFPAVRVLTLPENAGFAVAANAGLRAASGTALLLLNNDIVLADDCLAALAAALARHPEAAAFAVQLRFAGRPDCLNAAGDLCYSSLLPDNRCRNAPVAAAAEDLPVTGACAAAVLYRRELLAALGGFDEDFVMTFEDSDLSLRAVRAGYIFHYCAAAVAWHRQLATIGAGSARNAYHTVKNGWHLLTKHGSRRLLLRHALPIIAHRAWLMAAYAAGGEGAAVRAGLRAAWRETPRLAAKRDGTGTARLAARLVPLPWRQWRRFAARWKQSSIDSV